MNMVYILANQGRCCLEYNLKMRQLMKRLQPRSLPYSHCPLICVLVELLQSVE